MCRTTLLRKKCGKTVQYTTVTVQYTTVQDGTSWWREGSIDKPKIQLLSLQLRTKSNSYNFFFQRASLHSSKYGAWFIPFIIIWNWKYVRNRSMVPALTIYIMSNWKLSFECRGSQNRAQWSPLINTLSWGTNTNIFHLRKLHIRNGRVLMIWLITGPLQIFCDHKAD